MAETNRSSPLSDQAEMEVTVPVEESNAAVENVAQPVVAATLTADEQKAAVAAKKAATAQKRAATIAAKKEAKEQLAKRAATLAAAKKAAVTKEAAAAANNKSSEDADSRKRALSGASNAGEVQPPRTRRRTEPADADEIASATPGRAGKPESVIPARARKPATLKASDVHSDDSDAPPYRPPKTKAPRLGGDDTSSEEDAEDAEDDEEDEPDVKPDVKPDIDAEDDEADSDSADPELDDDEDGQDEEDAAEAKEDRKREKDEFAAQVKSAKAEKKTLAQLKTGRPEHVKDSRILKPGEAKKIKAKVKAAVPRAQFVADAESSELDVDMLAAEQKKAGQPVVKDPAPSSKKRGPPRERGVPSKAPQEARQSSEDEPAPQKSRASKSKEAPRAAPTWNALSTDEESALPPTRKPKKRGTLKKRGPAAEVPFWGSDPDQEVHAVQSSEDERPAPPKKTRAPKKDRAPPPEEDQEDSKWGKKTSDEEAAPPPRRKIQEEDEVSDSEPARQSKSAKLSAKVMGKRRQRESSDEEQSDATPISRPSARPITTKTRRTPNEDSKARTSQVKKPSLDLPRLHSDLRRYILDGSTVVCIRSSVYSQMSCFSVPQLRFSILFS
ncbi:hypothetical protein PENSPDRAFT_687024 [Peniophora sp. CONT]|nr:hypothetical protein PENSPDRAFT_687024 [Peniophora sp. CONT]